MSKVDKKKEQSVGASLGKAVKETCYFLTILFCVLRACGITNWSWFWIMSPIFFSWVISFAALAIAGIIAFAAIEDDN